MKKRITTFILSTVFVIVFLFPFAVSADTADGESYLNKISKNVFTAPKNENGEVTVIVSRKNVLTEEQYEEYFFNKFGFHGYECRKNKEYLDIVAEQLAQTQYEKYKDDVDDPEVLLQSLRDSFKNYIFIQRRITSEATTAQNKLFIEKNGLNDCEISYSGSFTGSIILTASLEKITELAKDESVVSIMWFENFENAVMEPYVSESGATGETLESGSANTETETDADAETTGAPDPNELSVGDKAIPLAAEGETKSLESENNGTQTENTDKGGFPWGVVAVICAVIAVGVVPGAVYLKKKPDGKTE